MLKKLTIIIALFSFLLFANAEVFAKAGKSSGSKASSSRSSGYSAGKSSSGGYSSGSKSKSTSTDKSSTGGYSAGSTSGYSGKSTASKPIGKQTTNSDKSTYLNSVYSKDASKNNYASYNQKMNPTQQESYSKYNTAPSIKKQSYSALSSTRTNRINDYNRRPIYVGYNTSYFPGGLYYGSAFAGRWDMWFLMRASDLFWYHHLEEIMMYNHMFDKIQMEQKLAKIAAMNNIPKDTNYLDPDVDYDLQYNPVYQQEHLSDMYDISLPWYVSGWFKFLLVALVAVLIILGIAKRWKKSLIIALMILEGLLLLWSLALLALSIGLFLIKLTIIVVIVAFIIWIIRMFSGRRGPRNDEYNQLND